MSKATDCSLPMITESIVPPKETAMSTIKKALFAVTFAVLFYRLAVAQGGYAITQWTIGSTGTTTGGAYILAGVVGQPLVGVSQGGNYILVSNYRLSDSLPPVTKVYLPLVTR